LHRFPQKKLPAPPAIFNLDKRRSLHARAAKTEAQLMKLIEIEQETTEPRFGRLKTVERLFGLKRGTVYNLLRARKIRGCSVCVTSNRSRTRLIDLDSVANYIESQMRLQNEEVVN
jgi:hypothetical protein